MALWYESESMLPPFKARVWVHWNGREFLAARFIHPKRQRPCWAAFQDGELIYLPPKGRSRRLGENPPLWRPEDPSRWPHDLPKVAAIVVQPEVAWSRVDLSPRDIFRAPDVDDWWRDATQVRYSPQGDVSMREAEARILRAISTGWTIESGGPRMSVNAVVLARLSESRSELISEYDYESGQFVDAKKDWRPPFCPTGADRDDFLVAMAWFAALNPVEFWHKDRRVGVLNRAQQVLCSRAMDPPLPWVFLGQRFGVTDERMRQVYRQSIEKIWRAANGLPVFRHMTPKDQMVALRGRNKAHAQQERER